MWKGTACFILILTDVKRNCLFYSYPDGCEEELPILFLSCRGVKRNCLFYSYPDRVWKGTAVVSEREYIFACILNELYKQTEYYNNHLTDFLSGNLPDFPWIRHTNIILRTCWHTILFSRLVRSIQHLLWVSQNWRFKNGTFWQERYRMCKDRQLSLPRYVSQDWNINTPRMQVSVAFQ